MSDIIKLSTVSEEGSFPVTYYDLADESHFWCRGRAEAFFCFLKTLPILSNKQYEVFDIGCGNGIVRRQIESRTAWITDGADMNYTALLKNEGLRGSTYYYNIFDYYQTFSGKYDIIILFDVLEHIEQPLLFLEALSYHLKQGGWLFINVPALEWLRSPYDTVQGHLRRYTKKTLYGEIVQSQFEPVAFSYWGLSLLPVAIARKLYLQGLRDKSDIYTRGFRPPSSLVNRALSGFLRIEAKLSSSVPLGTSLLGAARKS